MKPHLGMNREGDDKTEKKFTYSFFHSTNMY